MLETLPSVPFGCIAEHLSPRSVVRLSGCSRTLYARRLELLRLLRLAARHAALADAVIHRAPEEVQLLLSARATRPMVTADFALLLRMCCEHHGLAVLRSLHEQGLVEKADLLWTRQLPSMRGVGRVIELQAMPELLSFNHYDQDSERGCFPLLAAAAAGDVEVLRFLTTAFELSDADYEGHTGRKAPLRAACDNNQVEAVRYIVVELGFCRPSTHGGYGIYGYQPVWRPDPSPPALCAVRTGNRELVELLIEHQGLTADDFRIVHESMFGLRVTGIALRAAGEAGVDFLLWLLRRMEMTAGDLIDWSHSRENCVLGCFVKKDDMAGDLPRWLDAVQADGTAVVRVLCTFVDNAPLFKALLSLGRVTAADVTAGGENSLAVLAATFVAEAAQALTAPPLSLPRSALRAHNCAALRKALPHGGLAVTGLLGLSRDILEEEVRDSELAIAEWTLTPGAPPSHLSSCERGLDHARRDLAAWDRGKMQQPPPLFTADDKPQVLAELRASLVPPDKLQFGLVELRLLRLLTRRLGATRADLGGRAPDVVLTMVRFGNVKGMAALVKEGLLRPEDAWEHTDELLALCAEGVKRLHTLAELLGLRARCITSPADECLALLQAAMAEL